MFDLILSNMSRLPMPAAGGVLVACGDVLITFDFKSACLSSPGVTGFGFYDGAERASRHGVYQVDRRKPDDGVPLAHGRAGRVKVPVAGCRLFPVKDFLQKPKFSGGRHVIDTGIMWMDCATADKMVARGWKVGDLYQEFTGELLGGFAPFHVNVVRRCDFFHIGSSRELLRCMTAPSPTAKLYGFSVKDPNLVGRDIFAAASENIVTNAPADIMRTVSLRKGECVTFLPVGRSDWVEVRYSIDDNFKGDGKWERKLYRLGRRKVCLAEIMPQVNHHRLLKAREC